jgi:hypothetical protein
MPMYYVILDEDSEVLLAGSMLTVTLSQLPFRFSRFAFHRRIATRSTSTCRSA